MRLSKSGQSFAGCLQVLQTAASLGSSKLTETKEKYGNSSILFVPGAGNQGFLHGVLPVGILLGQFGGFSRHWGAPSYEAALFASMATYGTMMTGNAREDLLNTNL